MRVIGIGDNVVDRYTDRRVMFPGGNAVNFAVYAKQCGADAAYLGLLADEPEGRLIRDSLNTLGIDVSMSPLQEGLTTERCDVTVKSGDRVFVGVEYGEGTWEPLRLHDEHITYLKQFDVIHCGCYGEMAEEVAKLDVCEAVKTYDFSEEEEYRTDAYLETVCPHIDIALFSGSSMDEAERLRVREKAVSLGTGLVVITDGSKGQIIWDGIREYTGCVKMVDAVDTMGAGDSFFTAFVIELVGRGYRKGTKVAEEDISAAARQGADFSAQVCMNEGAFGFGTTY